MEKTRKWIKVMAVAAIVAGLIQLSASAGEIFMAHWANIRDAEYNIIGKAEAGDQVTVYYQDTADPSRTWVGVNGLFGTVSTVYIYGGTQYEYEHPEEYGSGSGTASEEIPATQQPDEVPVAEPAAQNEGSTQDSGLFRMAHWANVRDGSGNLIGRLEEGDEVVIIGQDKEDPSRTWVSGGGMYGTVLTSCIVGGYEESPSEEESQVYLVEGLYEEEGGIDGAISRIY